MHPQQPTEAPKESSSLSEDQVLNLKLFTAKYLTKNPKAKPREARRAAEKHFNIKIK